MGHAGKDMSDLHDKIKEDVTFRRKWAEQCGFGFELPSLYRMYQKTLKKRKSKSQRKQLKEREISRGERI
jgi:hypothetical protein